MNERKKKVVAVIREVAESKEPFDVHDVIERFEEPVSLIYIAHRLQELSTGSFPILRRVSKSSVPIQEREYVSSSVKPIKRKVLPHGIDKETFHALYGCFGVPEIVSGGRYLYNKQAANLVRKTVQVYISHQTPDTHKELRAFLKSVVERHSRHDRNHLTRQSLKIGIVHALQSHGENPEYIFTLLVEVFGDWATKSFRKDAVLLRANAAKLRQNLSR